ncbi:N-acetylmuramoyl-L-alanine amidase family protein [Lutispora thermophila]|uniref:N-acetylmuramoyl-L-alanine amidase n=1 Tax=Lutispora thermophila DSM 19022 TaxID=1122184 RepID=A0A1M6CJB2_9FIRM|nr:N-acetylmuramoyl-L-alanine amidase [Lutispora thermophila]SHI61003.1 N-acetylmuramoyl-L-alanine amidase [Lutispora thermophila DSM 19022]
MSLRNKKILIDPGHGGKDGGAEGILDGEKVYEKDLALMFAESVASYIENYTEATVIMTRDSDVDMGINERWKIGFDNNVDAVISIHWNSHNKKSSGTETIYAKTRSQDKHFAEVIQNKVVEYLGTNNRGVKDDTKTKVGSLGILRYPSNKNYPRALVEVEFIDNESAMEALNRPIYETSLDFATAIKEALEEYFG